MSKRPGPSRPSSRPSGTASARRGFNIFIANRGAVRFDYPRTWVMHPQDDGSIALTDREPPDDNCRLQVSVIELHRGSPRCSGEPDR